MIKRATDWTVFLFYVALGLLAVAAAVVILRMLHFSDAPAWTQAVGSIGAIIGTWIVATRQLKHAETLRY